MKTYWKFGALILVIVGALAWLAAAGISESKTYYVTVPELRQMGEDAQGKRLRVAGDVAPGSIVRTGTEVEFTLTQQGQALKCVYTGTSPLPDTFRDSAQAIADGKLGPGNVFQASQIQAKCASKYQADPGSKHPSQIRKADF